jgi:thioredoxin-like negative regulator of GroEL
MVAPVLEELSDTYDGKLLIYKVDTEVEQELAGAFGIQSIPTLLFIPANGQPMMQPGALPKNVLKDVIEQELLVKSAPEA